MAFPISEACGLPNKAKSMVGSVAKSLHMVVVAVSNERILIDKAISVPNSTFVAFVLSLTSSVEANKRSSDRHEGRRLERNFES